jgi:hypothetical protein
MPWAYEGLAQLLAKVQTIFDTAETSLDITNAQAVMPDQSSVQYKQAKTDMRLASTVFGVQKAVYGQATVDITAAFAVDVTGTSTEPHIGNWLKASGWPVTTATAKHTYTPSALYSDWKSLTVWGVTGDKESGDALLTKAGNSMFGFKISCAKVGDPTLATFTGMGVPVADPSATTYTAGSQTMPSGAYIPFMSASAVSIGGQAYKLLSYELTWDAKIQIIGSAASDYGSYRAIIGNDPRATIKMVVLQEQLATLNPFSNDKTAGTLTLTYGASGNRISITSGSNKFYFDPPTLTNADGVGVFEINGEFIDNSVNFIVNEA